MDTSTITASCLFLKLPYKIRTNHLTLYYYGKTEERGTDRDICYL